MVESVIVSRAWDHQFFSTNQHCSGGIYKKKVQYNVNNIKGNSYLHRGFGIAHFPHDSSKNNVRSSKKHRCIEDQEIAG